MYSYLLIIMLIGVGLYYTLRTRLVQVRMFRETIRVILEKPVESGAVSSFQALMVSTASRVGTGNIIGISTAICLGGYGAVFWMWVSAFLGMATAYGETVLGIRYREKGRNGGWMAGPMIYLEKRLGCPEAAVLYGFFCIPAAFGMGSMVQANAISETVS